MRSILITGVSASGKSTLSHEAARVLRVTAYDYADLMLKADPAITDKDALETLDEEHRRAIYQKVTALLPSWFGPANTSDQTILLENHLSVIHDGRIATFRTTAYPRYNARGLAVVSADPQVILARRTADPTRHRRPGTVDQIARQQVINQEQAQVITDFLEIPLLLVENTDLAASVATFVRWAEGLAA